MINVCKNCNTKFEHKTKKEFCSQNCMLEYYPSHIKYIEFTCEWCHKTFVKLRRYVVSENNKGKNIKFCSRDCANANRGKNRKIFKCAYCGKDFIKNPNQHEICCSSKCSKLLHEQNYVTRKCEYCGKEFTRKKSHMNKENNHMPGKYCSRECKNNAQANDSLHNCVCLECGKIFKSRSNKIFCNIVCRRNWQKKQRVYLSCKQCGKEFSVTKSRYEMYHTKYCSNSCKKIAIKTIKSTYANISHALRTSSEYKLWRAKVLSSNNYTCQECKVHDIHMHAHHIKELYKICLEYNFDINLILQSDIFNDTNNGQCLCESCHQRKHYQLRGETRNSKGQFCRLVSKELEDEMIRAELSGKAKPEMAC